MALDFAAAMAATRQNLSYRYGEAQTMLYSLATGFCDNPLDDSERAFVDEDGLRASPTLATVIAWGARNVRDLGVDYAKVLHGEQKLILHRPLPAAAEILADTRTKGVYDKGAGKGALIVSEISIRDAASNAALCTLETTHFARGDGGFSATSGDSGTPPPPHPIPGRPADVSCEIATDRRQALFYRLLGDRNRLHLDPEIARAAGFERPILHGLCTYGVACRAVLREVCAYRAEAIAEFGARFSAPVYPGETLRFQFWQDSDVVSFVAHVAERNALVLNNGRCVLR
jgi:acyl dehydratase